MLAVQTIATTQNARSHSIDLEYCHNRIIIPNFCVRVCNFWNHTYFFGYSFVFSKLPARAFDAYEILIWFFKKPFNSWLDDQSIFTTQVCVCKSLKLGKSFENLPHAVDRFVDQKALQFFHVNRVQKLKARENNTFIFDAFDWFFSLSFHSYFCTKSKFWHRIKTTRRKKMFRLV